MHGAYIWLKCKIGQDMIKVKLLKICENYRLGLLVFTQTSKITKG